jgi:hypothetical protein
MPRYLRAGALGLVHVLVFWPILAAMDFPFGASAAFAQVGGGGTGGGGTGGGGTGGGGGGAGGGGAGGAGMAEAAGAESAAAAVRPLARPGRAETRSRTG